jgi:ribonuclease P protein component
VLKAEPDLLRKLLRFSRSDRLISKHDFDAVFAKPHKISRKHFVVLNRPNQVECVRLGIIIRKLQVKRAVDRNRLRRIVRESFREHKNQLKKLDIVMILRSECTPLSKKSLREIIDSLWSDLS